MAGTIELSSIIKDKIYKIAGFSRQDSEYAIKLGKMGFIEGTLVELAPVNFSDPVVFDIRGSRIALRKNEARDIFVKEV